MNQNQRTVKKKAAALLTLLALMLMALLVAAAPASAGQESKGPTPTTPEETAPPARPETVTVTFELTIDGEVPEGKTILVGGGRDEALPSFCSTSPYVPDLPRCADGGTYSGTAELPAGGPFSYSYVVLDNASGTIDETFASGTRTFAEGDTVSATYTGTEEPGEETVTVTFELTIDGEVPEGYSLYLSGNRTDPPSPEPFGREFCHTDRPGEGLITCEDGGTYSQAYEVPRGSTLSYQYAWRDLYPTPGGDAPYFGTFFTEQRTFTEDATVSVTYTGTEEPGDETATLSFELNVECEPPAGTQFFGFIPAEGGMRAQLADSDGDGLYTGSMTVDKYGPGPRPVPPGTEPVTLGPIQIVEGTGREVDRVIEDFGEVKIDGDKAFTASDDSFCEGGGGSDDGGSDDNGSSDSDGGFLSGLLPETGGGWAVLLLIVGAVLIGGGWLLVRRIEQMYEQM